MAYLDLDIPARYGTVGLPTVESVATHEAAYPMRDKEKRYYGCLWFCYDQYRACYPFPTATRLRVTDGRVMLQNGTSFWQSLDECTWASKSTWVPCTPAGIPVGLLEFIDVPHEVWAECTTKAYSSDDLDSAALAKKIQARRMVDPNFLASSGD